MHRLIYNFNEYCLEFHNIYNCCHDHCVQGKLVVYHRRYMDINTQCTIMYKLNISKNELLKVSKYLQPLP